MQKLHVPKSLWLENISVVMLDMPRLCNLKAVARYVKVACVHHTYAVAASMCCQLLAWGCCSQLYASEFQWPVTQTVTHLVLWLTPIPSTVIRCQSMQYDQHL